MIYITEQKLNIIKEYYNLSSLMTKDELCPYIFQKNGQIIKEVRQTLLNVAFDFFDFLEMDWVDKDDVLKDIWLVGSCAGYNWSVSYSDIDVHLILDFEKISNHKELLEDDLWAYKELYNKKRNVKIKTFDVEVYAQDKDDRVKSDGIFSILRQTWIKKPVKQKRKINKRKINNIISKFDNEIEEALKLFNLGNYDAAQEMQESIRRKIRNLRKKALENGGEFTSENLAFKMLRRLNFMDKLDFIEDKSFEEKNSIGAKSDNLEKEKEISTNKDEANIKKPKGGQLDSKDKNEKEEEEDNENYSDGIQYIIQGKEYSSLRDAEDKISIPKSTIQYRVNSDLPKWANYKKISG